MKNKISNDAYEFYSNLVQKWGDALSSTPEKMSESMYAQSGVLVPTVDNDIRTNREGIANYFKEFMKHRPIMEHFENVVCQIFRENNVLDINHTHLADTVELTSYYHFRFDDGTTTNARYTFVFRYIKGKWLILNHHSSKLPHQDSITKYH